MKHLMNLIACVALVLFLGGCGGSSETDSDHGHGPDTHTHDNDDTHTHADGSTHGDHDHDALHGDEPGTHTHADGTVHGNHDDDGVGDPGGDMHDEMPLGTAAIGDMQVDFAQSHGAVAAGKEGHLAVRLPYSDSGATTVRAWIGTNDRTMSYVGKGDYTASTNTYDVHATAPSPLPPNTMWWVEIEKPDGTKVVGSVVPKK